MRLLAAFVVGVVSLTLELAYTRVISFKLFYYYTYFVIGLALLGLGAAAAITAVSPRLRRLGTNRLIALVTPWAALAGLVGYVVAARLPTDVNLIWTGSIPQALGQGGLLLVLSIALTTAFVGVGLIMASLFMAEADDVRQLYFWDLAGAALGCLVAVPLQATIGPPAMILLALVLLAGLGPVAVPSGDRRRRLVGVGVVVLVALGAVAAGRLAVRTDASKTLRDSDPVAAGDWGAVFRVDAVRFNDFYFLHHDGLWGSGVWPYDGTPATTARYDHDSRQIPFAAVPDEPRILIIGAAGGNEIQAALTYGVGHVDAVELNPVTVDILNGPLKEFSGAFVDDPRVNYVQGDGRTFLARSDDEYDLVWFVAPDSYAASNTATSGAFVLSESYLYTREMIETAYDHLSPDGVVVAQFGDRDISRRPTRTARYLVTARAALDGRLDGTFADHTILIVQRDAAGVDQSSTILLSRPPVTETTKDAVTSAVANVPDAVVVHQPGGTIEAGVAVEIITGTDDQVDAIVDDAPFEISAIDDNRPFFWHFTSFGEVLTDWDRTYDGDEIAIGERLLLVLVGLAAVVAAILLWLPFLLTRRRAEASVPTTVRVRTFLYFGALGLGFMFVEISMIQRFALLLGFPTLSLSVSLFALLLATAVGARWSALVRRVGGLVPVTAALVALVVGYLFVAAPITDAALSWPQWARIVLVFALLLPIGTLLGVFLPTGMDAVAAWADANGADRDRLIAWAWAVNGFFSVLGSSLTTLVSMAYGFDRAVLAGLALYGVATLIGTRGRWAAAPLTSLTPTSG